MAIKGKGRTRSRAPARAPKAAPIPVKPPMFSRQWVVAVVSPVAGLGLAAFGIWAYVGVHNENRDKAAAARLRREVPIVQSFQGQMNAAISKVGTITPGQPPVVFTDLSTLVDSLAKGTVPKGAVDTASTAAKNAGDAATAIEKISLSDEVGGKGFELGQTLYFFNAQSKVANGLHLYKEVAELAKTAATADKTEMVDLATRAQSIRSLAQAQVSAGFDDLKQLRASVGLFDQPQVPGAPSGGIPGVPGGSAGIPGAGS